ncbi:hypothetical protein ALP75_203700 [Pseudomonas syringae pv. actinidiae]|nr:hypothetical protein ALP75_203700 [Pseudomonas syringae pv. actinidiae]
MPVDTDTGVQDRARLSRSQAYRHFPGARVCLDIAGVNRPAGIQGLQISRVGADVNRRTGLVVATFPTIVGDRLKTLVVEVPDAGVIDIVDIARASGNQFCRFQQGIGRGVTVAGQAQDKVLLGAHSFKVCKLVTLGTLVEFQGNLQP